MGVKVGVVVYGGWSFSICTISSAVEGLTIRSDYVNCRAGSTTGAATAKGCNSSAIFSSIALVLSINALLNVRFG